MYETLQNRQPSPLLSCFLPKTIVATTGTVQTFRTPFVQRVADREMQLTHYQFDPTFTAKLQLNPVLCWLEQYELKRNLTPAKWFQLESIEPTPFSQTHSYMFSSGSRRERTP